MNCSSTQIYSEKPIGGRYKILSQLGAGGFGYTFLAEDVHLPGNPRCVVKQLKLQTDDTGALEMARRCFHTEAQALYKLGCHDQIPRLMAHFEESQEFYLVQEFIEGKSLTKELVKGKSWPQTDAIALVRDILEILFFVHQEQVIHRDLKPSNLIRRCRDNKIVLIDFGAVKQASTPTIADPETGLTNLTISIGTQGYMPNEQIAGKPRFSSDVYAVGIIGIQALTGVHPRHFGEDARGEIEWHHRARHVSRELVDILDRMVRYDFRDRFPTAIEALEALDKLPSQAVELPSLTLIEIGERQSEPIEAPTSQGFQLNGADPEEPTLPELEQASTEIWQSTEFGSQSVLAGEATGSTEAVSSSRLEPSDRTEFVAPTRTIKPKWLIPTGAALTAVIAAGAIFAWVRFNLFQSPVQVINQDIATRVATTAQIAKNSIPTPTPIDPKQRAAELVKQANRLRSQGEYQQALDLYDQAIKLRSDFAEAYWGRCDSLNGLRQPDPAIVACNDALAYKPDYAEAFFGQGNAYIQRGQWFEALPFYERATRLKPDFAAAWVRRGMALQGVGRSEEALKALEQGINLNRDSAEAWTVRGAALRNLGRYEKAIASLDKALELDPDNPTANDLRQQIREEYGR